jgi:hypothetical protein
MADQGNPPTPAPTTETQAGSNSDQPPCYFGRKYQIFIIGIIVYGMIVVFKADVTGKEALDNLVWLVLVAVGGIALEDGIGKFKTK